MPKPFVYDEKTSRLYSPEGEFIKDIFCPKALQWNQLISNGPRDRCRGCEQCGDEVVNLDVIGVDEAMKCFSSNRLTCAYASSDSPNVIFIKDLNSPELKKSKADRSLWGRGREFPDLPRIATVRNIEDIERAVSIGYWPDVHIVQYKDKEILQKVGLFQNMKTGAIKLSGDYRYIFNIQDSPEWEEVMPVTFYYSGYQESPFAAYLIPKDLPDGSSVFIPDPITDFLGETWNQGDTYRAINVIGKVMNKKIIINPADIKVTNFIG